MKFIVATLIPPKPQEQAVMLEMDKYTVELVFDILFDIEQMLEGDEESTARVALRRVVHAFDAVRKAASPVVDLRGTKIRLEERA